MAEFPAVLKRGDKTRIAYDATGLVQAQYEGYALVAEGADIGEPVEPPQYPHDFTVSEVNAYLADADEEERDRVLTEERNNKARAGILDGPHA